MAQNITVHLPILPVWTTSGNQEAIQNILESASATFNFGTPVQLNASGNVKAWDGTTITAGIVGIAAKPGQNLASAGKGASSLYGMIGFPGGITYGTVPNQTGAANILPGPFFDGLSQVYLANPDTTFIGQVDASSGGTYAATQALVGTQLGMTADGNGYWYVDLAKTTVGTNTILTVVGLSPLWLVSGSTTTQVNNGQVYFKFNVAATQNYGG